MVDKSSCWMKLQTKGESSLACSIVNIFIIFLNKFGAFLVDGWWLRLYGQTMRPIIFLYSCGSGWEYSVWIVNSQEIRYTLNPKKIRAFIPSHKYQFTLEVLSISTLHGMQAVEFVFQCRMHDKA